MVGPHAKPGSPAWAKVTGLRLLLYSNSLGLVMGLVFFASWTVQSIAGQVAYNEQQLAQLAQLAQLEQPVTWWGYVTSADFWSRTTQNWRSEFLTVASMAALSIYLRQRGSPESKPVGASHDATGLEV